ncbi:MAG: OmpA family protein, partial [Gammaproteobacteria bacterium]|nr:OmpA family protein [Gammaproteobacteria bacterium]
GGIFASVTIDRGTSQQILATGAYSVLQEPTFTVRMTRGQLDLSGTTASAEHETGLIQVLDEHFHNSETRTSFVPGIAVPDSWIAVSVQLLYALAAMESATAIMSSNKVILRGITSDAATLAARLDFLKSSMPEGAVVDEDIIVVDGGAALDSMCERTFAQLASRPVVFRRSSAELRGSSYSNLDRIIDFAYDCNHMNIAIIGHSDAWGDATWNDQLSLARAQVVADYLVRSGIPAERLLVEGKGSSSPIADNETALGRSRNRRIEFELR